MAAKKVLITGVYGLIGNLVYQDLAQHPEAYEVYGLARRRQHSERLRAEQQAQLPEERFFLANLGDFDAVSRAVQGMDVVVHLAADPSGAHGWESVLQNNIIGSYHVLEASRLAGVQRVIFASSVQVSFGYGVDAPYGAILSGRLDEIPAQIPIITHDQPTRPMNLYASSKVWGEALTHMMAYRHGMSGIVLRIGWVVAENQPPGHTGTDWCSHRDICQITRLCIDAPESLRFDVFYAVSDNRYRFLDIAHAREVLGYAPQDGAKG